MSSNASALQDFVLFLGKKTTISWFSKKKQNLSALCLNSLLLDKTQQGNPFH